MIGTKIQKVWKESGVPTVVEIKSNLAEDDRWVIRGMLAIYEKQTADEKEIKATTEHNGVGFSGCDAEILSSFAEQWIQRGSLSPRQMEILRKKMQKYASQIWTLCVIKAERSANAIKTAAVAA